MSAVGAAFDVVAKLIEEIIFAAVPELRSIVRVLDFSQVSNFIENQFDAIRGKFKDLVKVIAEEIALDKLNVMNDLDAHLRQKVWTNADGARASLKSTVSGPPILTFACDPGYYPVVNYLLFSSPVCEEKDYARYVRFPCPDASPNKCNVSMATLAPACFLSPPRSPEVNVLTPNLEVSIHIRPLTQTTSTPPCDTCV